MDKIGRYQLLRLLGEGAMGQVYLALLRGPAGFEKQFAIKILRETSAKQLQNTIISEGRIGGILRHPNVVEVFELGQVDDKFFLVMEFVDGIPLDQALAATLFSPRACVDLAIQIAQGLCHIHEQDSLQLVHSDIKPSNILISRAGLVKIADLGLIRSSFEAVEINRGTPGYMAPEHARNEVIDQRADIFSLGLVLVETLLGKRFFFGSTPLQLLSQVTHAELIFKERFEEELSDIHPQLMKLLKKMLRQDREKRPLSMRAVLDELTLLSGLSGKGLFSILQEEEFFAPLQRDNLFLITEKNLSQNVVFNQKRILKDVKRGLQETSVLVIKGASGQGKSRTLQILQNSFAHSILLDGASFSRLEDILQAILQRLHAEASGEDAEKELARLFDSWEELFLLIDNVDELKTETWKQLSRLARTSKVKIIMTSTLRVSQQHVLVYELPVFSKEMSWSLFKTRVSERGEIFRREDREIWDTIIEKSDGIPLVIELLAAQYCLDPGKILSLDQVWKETALERAFEQSYASSLPEEQKALQKLAYFQAPFSLLSASQMLGVSISKTNQIIDALHRSSLLFSQSVSFSREPYFKISGGMKSLLRSKIQAEAKRAIELQYAQVCARWFDQGNQADFENYFSFQLAKIIALPDCLKALEIADFLGMPELLWKNVLAACQIFALVGPRQKGIDLIDEYVSESEQPNNLFGGLGKLWKGVLYLKIGEEQKAKTFLEEAVTIFEDEEDLERQQKALCYLIFALAGLKSEESLWLYQQQFQRKPVEITTKALFYQAMGYFYTQKGDVKAVEYLQKALSIYWSLGDNRQVVSSLISVGVIFFRQNRHQIAEKNYRKAIEIAERCNLQEGLEAAWMNLALISIMSNRISEALMLFTRSRERYQQLGNRSALALLEANWAMLCLLEKDFQGVKLHLKRSSQQLTQNPIILHTHHGVQGLTALEQGNIKKAVEYLGTAWGILQEYTLSFKRAETLALLGEALLGEKNFQKAEQILSELASMKGSPLYDFWNSLLLSSWCYQQGNTKLGDSHLLTMIRLLQNSQFPERPDLWLHIQRIRNRFGR